jgi:predicted ribosome quality control (RQC) complex YloA/Tae2 family protein
MNFISVLRDQFPFSKISKIFQIDFTRIIKEEFIEIIKEASFTKILIGTIFFSFFLRNPRLLWLDNCEPGLQFRLSGERYLSVSEGGVQSP